jgi:hypothetical protein
MFYKLLEIERPLLRGARHLRLSVQVSTARSVVFVSGGDASFTRRHTPGGPLPELAQCLRVEDMPPAHREGPGFNQVQEVAVFGQFLRPALGDRIGLPPTVPIAGTF